MPTNSDQALSVSEVARLLDREWMHESTHIELNARPGALERALKRHQVSPRLITGSAGSGRNFDLLERAMLFQRFIDRADQIKPIKLS